MTDKIFIIGKIAVAMFIIVCFYFFNKWVFNRKTTHKIFSYLEISPISSKDITFITVVSFFLGYFFREFPEVSRPLLFFAYTAPFFGLFNILSNRQNFRKSVAKIPVLGDYMTCPLATDEKVQRVKQEMKANGIDDSDIQVIQKCTLTCEHCRGVDAIKIIGGWSITKIAIPWVFRFLNLF